MRRDPRLSKALCLLSYLALAVACGGEGSGTPSPPPPSGDTAPAGLSYATNPCTYRAGEAVTPNLVSLTTPGDPAPTFAVAPPLPAGLTFDTSTGAVGGTPSAASAAADHVVTATNAAGSASVTLNVAVGPALPAAFEFLQPGFDAEVIYEDAAPVPVKLAKIALAGDGRVFFNEVDTGKVRVFDPAAGGLQATPFASLTVLGGGHNGLLGLALAPDFTTSGHVYVLATVPAEGGHPDRIKVVRYTDVDSIGTNETTVLDDLPVTPPMGVNNGGELVFDHGGYLFVSLGDTQNETLAQADAGVSLAGKVLRYDVSSLPAQPAAGNPYGDAEWVRGLRNTFGMAVHPVTGGLFGADNGPDANDELNWLSAGKNFDWGGMAPGTPGIKIRNYQTVIVPTALCWQTGGWGAAWNNALFMTTYEDHTVEHLTLSGDEFIDFDDQAVFARFKVVADDNHPLDVERAADGSLYVSTFTGIYRISKP